MCFHTALNVAIEALGLRYKRTAPSQSHFQPSFHHSGFVHTPYPIITQDPVIQEGCWGLIPYWIKDKEDALRMQGMTLNARSESVFDKPSFKKPIRSQRCLVPVNGFFDWKHQGKEKIPYFIYLPQQPIFSLGGIYEIWLDPLTGKK